MAHVHVSLIIPPSGFLLDEKCFMSLGVLKVAASLEQCGYPVSVLDLSGVPNYLDVVRAHVAESECMYGITVTTPQLPAAHAIKKAIIGERQYSKVILGGPHVTLTHAAMKHEIARGMRYGRARNAMKGLWSVGDVLVAGDGEKAIVQALEAPMMTMIDADDPASSLFLTRQDLDTAPFPARHMIDVDSYHWETDGVPSLSVMMQLGCPFACTFCGGRLSASFRRVRTRSSDRVVAELEHLYNTYGVTGFVFMDDEVNVSPLMIETMNAIAALQDRLGVRFTIRGHIKAQLLTDTQADALVRAGFTWIYVGFESGDDRMLLNIQKKATKAENTRCLDIARCHGLKVKALMSIGQAGESHDSITATHRWLLDVKPDDIGISVITVYPGTPYYDDAVQTSDQVWTYTAANGDRLHARDLDFRTEQAYFKGIPGEYHAYVWTDHLTSAELVARRDEMDADLRSQLPLPELQRATVQYEQSMGQSVAV